MLFGTREQFGESVARLRLRMRASSLVRAGEKLEGHLFFHLVRLSLRRLLAREFVAESSLLVDQYVRRLYPQSRSCLRTTKGYLASPNVKAMVEQRDLRSVDFDFVAKSCARRMALISNSRADL